MKLCPHPLFLLLSFLQNVTCPPFSSEDYYSLEYGGLSRNRNIPTVLKPPIKPTDIHGVHRKYPSITHLRAAVEREVLSEEEEAAAPPIANKNSSDATYNNIHINIMVNTAGGQVTMTVSNSSGPAAPEVTTATTTTTIPEPKTTSSTTQGTTKSTEATTTAAAKATAATPIVTTPAYVTEAPVISRPISDTANELQTPVFITPPETIPAKVTTPKTTTPRTTTTTTAKATQIPPKLETISIESFQPVSTSNKNTSNNANTSPCIQCDIVEIDNSFIVPKLPENKPPTPSPLPWEAEPDDKVMYPAVGFNRQCRSYFDCGFQVGENKSRTWLRCIDNFCTCELLGYVRDEESGWSLFWSREAQACISTWNGPCGFSKGLEIHCHLGCECGRENVCEKPGIVWQKPTTTTTTLPPPVKVETKRPLNRPPPVNYSEEECEEQEKKEEEPGDGGTAGSKSSFDVFSFLLFPSLNAVNTILNQSLNSVR